MEQHVAIDGVKLACTLSGDGPNVVLLHGWMCHRGFWKEQIRFLSKAYRVLALDFRGHGESEVTKEGHSIEQYSEDVYRVTQELGLKTFVLVGHSMGGMVAQHFSISHPESVSGLVLVTTIAADVEGRLISKRIEAEAPYGGFRKAFLKFFDGWFGETSDPSIVRWVREQMLQTQEAVALSLVRSYRRFDLRANLPQFSWPTLVVGASSDASAVPQESKILAELIPGAQLAIIEGSGHFPMLERPQTLNQILGDFLLKNTP
jgi:pimeloyl-ACP methyl ester carboxylesterase